MYIGNNSSNITAAAAVDNSAAIGGGVGGAVVLILLIVALCIMLRCMIKSHRRKKTKYFGDSVRFSKTLQDSILSHNLRYVAEVPNTNATEVESNVEARICKYSYVRIL